MSVKNTSVKIWRRSHSLAANIGLKGTIVSFTIVRVAPSGFSHYTPFPVVIVKFSNGKRMLGQLTDYKDEDIKSGRSVITVLRRLHTEGKKEAIPYVIKFKPL